ncbi:MAG: cytochrome c oxidase subunit II [Deltaproteobacteria bacterium]|nr:cytochrome c oxidase subunit II [Deltaproteobacteria bacterium]
MIGKFSFWPEQASSVALEVDLLYIFIIVVTVATSLAVYTAAAIFIVKYKRRSEDEIPEQIEGNLPLEIIWSLIPLGIVLVMFVWGIVVFYDLSRTPSDALSFNVVGKQWMWKIQHPTGKREINELHVPLGQSVKLTITSEDVLHSFFIPAFRTKMDAVPGRYTTSWFKATKTGEFHIFCAEYCGTKHSHMIGRVVVLDPAHYEQWLKTGSTTAAVTNETPEVAGARLFMEQRCNTCHVTNGLMAPLLAGVFGSQVTLQGGATVTADENYLRESIVTPQAKIVNGYQPNMPTFQGQITEESIMQLIAYIKSLSKAGAGAHGAAATAPVVSTSEAQAAPLEERQPSPPTEHIVPPVDEHSAPADQHEHAAPSDPSAAATENQPAPTDHTAPAADEHH